MSSRPANPLTTRLSHLSRRLTRRPLLTQLTPPLTTHRAPVNPRPQTPPLDEEEDLGQKLQGSRQGNLLSLPMPASEEEGDVDYGDVVVYVVGTAQVGVVVLSGEVRVVEVGRR